MTKLYLPLPGKYRVERSRLVDKLNQCLEPGCRLGLVSAGAGFGKTSLVSAWATGAKARIPDLVVAWLSLDPGDNDPVTFWTYTITALQAQQPGLGQKALNLLAAQGALLESVLASFINDLYSIDHPCVLIFDDFHLVRNPTIHQSLAYFVEHLPQHAHLLIASRTDPPLPLALLRGRGQLLELRLSDLRFSDEDAETYLNGGIGLNLAQTSVQKLNQKTEGWIAGLQMAALAMQDLASRGAAPTKKPEQGADFVASFSGSNRYILDYLIEEVLNRQPESVQHFLVRTSILDQLCGPICDALLASDEPGPAPGSQATLEYLENCNLFLFPLDDQRYWYRYHQLFADLLRKRLAQSGPALMRELHRRAMTWYEQNGLVPRAIHHAFESQDHKKAAALVAAVTEELWGRGEHATLLAWMDALPEEAKQNHPSLLTFQVSMLISAGKLKEAEACIPILERYIEVSLVANPDQPALIGRFHTLRTYIASFYGDRPALFSHARLALDHLTRAEDAGKRCGVLLVLASGYFMEGRLEDAGRAFQEAIDAAKQARKPSMMLTGFANLGMVLWFQGNLKQAARVCQEGLQMIEQYGFDRSPMAADCMIGWGEVLLERGALAEAETHLMRGVALAQEQHFTWQTAWGYQALARLRLAQANLAEAEAAAQAGEQWSKEQPVPALFSCESAGQLAEIWLQQGRLAQAAQHLQTRPVEWAGELQFPHHREHLAYARLRWLQGDRESAVRHCERIYRWAAANQQTRTMLSALILQAMLHASGGNHKAGLVSLTAALQQARPEDYVQLFVKEGDALAGLLREAVQRGIEPDYAARLLRAFPALPAAHEAGARPAMEAGRSAAGPARPKPVSLADPLSPRELETLRYIAEGLSNKEIALRMSVSLRTVKYYSTGLYNKLGVDSRMQAVVRARELGLLDGSP